MTPKRNGTPTPVTEGSRQDRHNKYGYSHVVATRYLRKKLGDPPGFYTYDVKESDLASTKTTR